MNRTAQKNKIALRFLHTYSKLLAGLVFAGMLLMTFNFSSSAAAEIVFQDIQGHWAEADIGRAVNAGYIKGYADATFKPDNPVKRSEFITMLNAAFGVPAGGTGSNFLDIHENDWFAQSIWSAVNAGYMGIYTDNIFNPNLPIPRQEAAALTANLAGIVPGSGVKAFTDTDGIAVWASNQINALVSAGVMDGYPDGTFRPDGKISRAEAVALINRARIFAGSIKVTAMLTVTGSVVNIRSGPDTSYGVVKKVYGGDMMNASLLSSDNWYKVDSDGTAGWITGSYVSAFESAEAEGTGGRGDTATGQGSAPEQDGAASGQNGDTTGKSSTANQSDATNQSSADSGQDGNVSRGGDPGRVTTTGSNSSGSAIQIGGTGTDGSGSGADSSANPDQSGASGRLVVIDAGHGGYDDGATGPSGTREKDITLSIALKLSELLKGAGYNTLMTRSDDTFISLPDRSLAANGSKADIFVSIHCNSSEYHTGRGTEVYTEPDRLNPVYKQQENSRYLAGLVQNELINALGLTDRGIREKDLAVCRETNTPAILIETAFIDVKEEEMLLNDPSFQDKTAAAVKLGIDGYFSGK